MCFTVYSIYTAVVCQKIVRDINHTDKYLSDKVVV